MGSSDYMALLLRQVSAHKFHSNPISSEYMGRESTWVVRVHAASEYMGYDSTWSVRLHGPTITPCQCTVPAASDYMGHDRTSSTPTQSHQSTWVITVHGWSEYMGSSDYMALLLRQVSAHKFHSNPISSEYMGRESTWVVRVHAASEYMGYDSTWSVRLHGPTITPCQCTVLAASDYMGHDRTTSTPTQSHQSTWVITVHGWSEYMGSSDYMALLLRQVSEHKFHSNPISSEYMGSESTCCVRIHGL